MFRQTALTSVDSYKLGHADQYPAGTTKVYSNFTPRSEWYFNIPDQYKDGHITWFGLQGFLQEMKAVWNATFFLQPRNIILPEIAEIYAPFCGPNGFDTSRLEALWELGYLPLEIKSLPEGARVPIGVPVLTITNTLSEFYWLPNFMETWLSTELWKSSTSASTSFVYRKIINRYAEMTGGSKEFIDWQGHDFSMRGMSGVQDAAKSGAGHLISFTGTDNIAAVKYIRDAYRGKETFIGGSVPATEHSVMCAGGKESEVETFRRLLKTYPSGVVSIVSDTWDFWNVITNTARELKEEILARTPDQFGLAKTVFRPDSGDPVLIICGDPEAEIGTPQYDGAVVCLAQIFGVTTNSKGYHTLNSKVGLIYGDSITPARAEQILFRLQEKGFASDNIVFGIGSFTFQYATRDSLGFAMKATYVEIDGVGQTIFKDPKTDSGTKKSAKGLLKVHNSFGEYLLQSDVSVEEEKGGCLETVFLDGFILVDESFAEIRARSNRHL
jgi:nicotinamide phosphoribosyltransferase